MIAPLSLTRMRNAKTLLIRSVPPQRHIRERCVPQIISLKVHVSIDDAVLNSSCALRSHSTVTASSCYLCRHSPRRPEQQRRLSEQHMANNDTLEDAATVSQAAAPDQAVPVLPQPTCPVEPSSHPMEPTQATEHRPSEPGPAAASCMPPSPSPSVSSQAAASSPIAASPSTCHSGTTIGTISSPTSGHPAKEECSWLFDPAVYETDDFRMK